VYRIIQEALTNVARHSHATNARVDVTVAANRLQLVVDDDGAGIQSDDAVTAPRGLGVIGMRERAQSLSGTLSIEPRLTGGTRVNVVIPLTPLNQGEGTISTVRIPA
jgi:signal transduction histidine kinase